MLGDILEKFEAIIPGFVLGIIFTLVIANVVSYQNALETGSPIIEINDSDKSLTEKISSVFTGYDESVERLSPSDRIKEDQIFVYNDRVVIYIDNPEWARFTDTNSMDPLLDDSANAIEIVPKSPEEIRVGDIISYESEYASGTFIHRVVKTGSDENGWYCTAKGDNNPTDDPGRIRFKQIKRVLVAVIY